MLYLFLPPVAHISLLRQSLSPSIIPDPAFYAFFYAIMEVESDIFLLTVKWVYDSVHTSVTASNVCSGTRYPEEGYPAPTTTVSHAKREAYHTAVPVVEREAYHTAAPAVEREPYQTAAPPVEREPYHTPTPAVEREPYHTAAPAAESSTTRYPGLELEQRKMHLAGDYYRSQVHLQQQQQNLMAAPQLEKPAELTHDHYLGERGTVVMIRCHFGSVP
jgi:hypothetical protein